MSCPSAEDLASFASGQRERDVELHVAECAACARIAEAVRVSSVSSVADDERAAPTAPDELQEPALGDAISRYVLLRRLGRGGMGVVLLAYDPVLDRMVALKLMRNDRASEEMSARLQREAQSLAQITHPNVVRIFDAGIWNRHVFLAMEHVEGQTLRAWLETERRPRADIVRVFTGVARGLAATHAAGFVHRDIKPDNMLIGVDGVARLADFGLAAWDGADPDPLLTPSGSTVGTPAYMAPEQRTTGDVGAAADQFALCVSLWEALFGVMPFSETSFPAIVEPPADRGVPSWLVDVVRRGLRPTPEERWPSIDALIEALGADPVAARRRRVTRGAVAAAFAAAVGLAVFGLMRDTNVRETRCQEMGARLSGVWDPDRAAAMRDAFKTSGRPYARDTFDRVAEQLDGYTRDWVAARTDTCEATHLRGEQSEALLDLRMACLDRRLADVDALVNALAAGTSADVIDKAVQATTQLSPLSRCADAEALQELAPAPSDPAIGDAIAKLSSTLATARALDHTAQYRDGLAIAAQAVATAEQLDYAPALAEALHLRASLEEHTGDAKAAEATLEQALVAAADARDDALAARVWADRVYVTAIPLGRPDDAVRLRPGAQAALRRGGSPPAMDAALSRSLGIAMYAQGHYDQARTALLHAATLLEKTFGAEDLRVAPVLNALGIVASAQGNYEGARDYYARALAIFERTVGAQHPDVAAALTNMGIAASAAGDYDDARTRHERAIAIWESTLGPDHSSVASGLTNLGLTLLAQGDYDRARKVHARALVIRQKALDPSHPDIAVSLNNLGSVLQVKHDYAGARAYHERALAIRQAVFGADHPEVGVSLNNLADALTGLGEHADALARYQRALAIWEKSLGLNHPQLAYALGGIAETELALGHASLARESAQRAVELREADGLPPEELGRSRFLLARIVWPQDGRRALELARQAMADFENAGDVARTELADVQAWLRSRNSQRSSAR